MKQILNKIFLANAFQDMTSNKDIAFYKKIDNDVLQEFFIVQIINKSEFAQTEDLFESGLQVYEEMKSSQSTVSKNTSLILAVEVNDLNADLSEFKNKILQIEEDTFWFKKYVIFYTQGSIASLVDVDDILVDLKNILLDNARFQTFKSNIFSDEEYLVTIQIFLKLPFLQVPVDNMNEFVSIDLILTASLSDRQKSLLTILNTIGDIETELNWNDVKELALRHDTSDVTIDEFLAKFSDNA